MAKCVQLLHSIHSSALDSALQNGLRAESEFPHLDVDIRQGVVYCWMSKDDDKMSVGGQRPDRVYVQVTVDEDRCTVADMTYISLAMMYHEGQGSKPKNLEAAKLFAEIYRVTAVPLSEYKPGMFHTPEVLVKGDIGPAYIRVLDD